MLWTATLKNDPAPSTWEPIELTVLKRKLATLSCHICNCITARRGAPPTTSNITPKAVSFEVNPNDKDVQVGRNICSFDRFTQACEADILKDQSLNYYQQKDMCPSCYVTMNLLRAGKLFKVLKDEVSETATETCDKSTEKIIDSVEETTSFSSSPCDDNTEYCRVATYSDTSLFQDGKQLPHVKFWDGALDTDINGIFSPPCVCMDDLINAIRPSHMLQHPKR